MKRILSLFLAVVIVMSFSVQTFAASAQKATEEYDRFCEYLIQFDVNGNTLLDPGDARATLRHSAGLEVGENEDASKMDVDSDGIVTSIDARYLLRLSVGLESVLQYIPFEDQLACFNSLVNLPRANADRTSSNYYRLYANTIDQIGDVILKEDSNKVITNLNNGMNKLAESEADKVDFAKTLTSGFKANTSMYDSTGCSSIYSSAIVAGLSRNLLPVIRNTNGVDEKKASYITADDVESIEYKTNQTYKFIRYGTIYDSTKQKNVIDTTNILYEQDVAGLDALVLTLKQDNSISGIHTSKAFIVEDEDEIMDALSGVNEDFDFSGTGMDEYGDFDFNMATPVLDSFKYHNSTVTVYFYPDTGNIVAIKYSMNTQYTVKLWMDIYFKLNVLTGIAGSLTSGIDLTKPLVDATGNVYITNNETTVQEFLFFKNIVK